MGSAKGRGREGNWGGEGREGEGGDKGKRENTHQVDFVERANVVQTTASNEVSRGRIGASHNPGRAERNGLNLIGRLSVPAVSGKQEEGA